MLHACCRSSNAAGMDRGQSPEESQGMASAWAQLIDASTPRGDRSPHLSCELLRWEALCCLRSSARPDGSLWGTA